MTDKDYTETLATLESDIDCAQSARQAATKAREAAEIAEKAAWQVEHNAHDAYRAFGDETAKQLNDSLVTDEIFSAPTMEVFNQKNRDIVSRADFSKTEIYFWDGKLSIGIGSSDFDGDYDTPSQVIAVITLLKAAIARGDKEFVFPTVEELNAPVEIIDAIIDTLPEDMQDISRRELTPFKHEYAAALDKIYLDDLTGGPVDNPQIILATELLERVIPLAVTEHSSKAYRKNADGTFAEDSKAFKRLEMVERRIFTTNGHKFGF